MSNNEKEMIGRMAFVAHRSILAAHEIQKVAISLFPDREGAASAIKANDPVVSQALLTMLENQFSLQVAVMHTLETAKCASAPLPETQSKGPPPDKKGEVKPFPKLATPPPENPDQPA